MSLRRSLTGLLLIVALPSIATRAFARRSGAVGPADEPQVRELLSRLAAASGTPEPEERTEADLMYEAMLRWNGEPADSKTIDRVLDQSKRDAARTKRVMIDKVRHMFWKDPFSDDPHRLIPVRQEDRDLLDSYARKSQRGGSREARASREQREPRDEVTRLREEVSRLRAENARIRERAEAISDQGECVADASTSDDRRRRRHVPGGNGGSVHSHHGGRPAAQIALVSTTMMESDTPPPSSSNVVPAHGIIIERLPSPAPPPVESGRRHGARVR